MPVNTCGYVEVRIAEDWYGVVEAGALLGSTRELANLVWWFAQDCGHAGIQPDASLHFAERYGTEKDDEIHVGFLTLKELRWLCEHEPTIAKDDELTLLLQLAEVLAIRFGVENVRWMFAIF